jgi:hypothetical protein
MEAAWNGTDEAVKLLLEAGADPNAQDSSGWTPLMFAVIHRGPIAVKLLLDAGARANTRDELGHTALKEVVTCRLPGFFDQLIYNADRRYVRERQQIAQMLTAAGGIE